MRCFTAIHKHQAGVTVIELMVTLSIAVVLMTVAVPGFMDMVADAKRIGMANQLVGMLSMARNEAIQRGVRVSICKSRDPNAAVPACAPTANWHEGWLLFVDNTHIAGNQMGVIDGTDRLLRVALPSSGMTLTTGSHYSRGLSYEPDGTPWGITSRGSRTPGNDTFTLTSNGVHICITVSLTGRASVRQQGQLRC